jgi:hypothetical protein
MMVIFDLAGRIGMVVCGDNTRADEGLDGRTQREYPA